MLEIKMDEVELIEAKKGAADFKITLESVTNTQLKF